MRNEFTTSENKHKHDTLPLFLFVQFTSAIHPSQISSHQQKYFKMKRKFFAQKDESVTNK